MQGVLMSMVQRPWQHEGGNSAVTLSWRVRMDVRGWWSLCVKLVLRGKSPLLPPVVQVQSTGRATQAATAGATGFRLLHAFSAATFDSP